MSSRISWEDILWEDPDGGTILLHGTIPTLVYPRKLRPSKEWHGLALLESEEVVDLWRQEEKDELESNGVNLAHGLISGGTMGLFLEEVMQLEDITAGRFPDPEPRRVHRLAERHDRPVFFIEPELDDQAWEDHMIAEAKEVSRWKKLFGLVTVGKKWRKRVKQNIFQAEKPPKGVSPNHSSAAVLSATWWDLNEWLIGEKISHNRNLRFAARLRGALAELRQEYGASTVLLVPLFLPWRQDIAELLQTMPKIEENSSNKTSTGNMEEE
ncbi:MAG: hypothetical protein ISR23_05880 [Candidatus Poseidoniaceae archaeon]|nr:hypothetical protein [Candidatus Poseidoniaceae archaeon]